ncbi:hypothetical protein AAFN60_07290 [Roseibacillus persicicus]|uniref:hypothetical protein n=1 Tax=Roseibacillus persicicus TaxID=454148 RepID=UPI00398B5245
MLTPVDHWLRETFLLETHFYCLRLPEKVPSGVKVRELPNSPTSKYRYRLIARSNRSSDRVVKKMNEEGLMFATQVVEKKTPLKPLIAPKGGSVLLNVFWMFSFMGLTFGALKLVKTMSNDEVFVENLRGAVALFMETGEP